MTSGCDNCRSVIDFQENGTYLHITVFSHSGESFYMHFCGWRCCLEKTKSVSTDFFIALPYLHYDDCGDGMGAKDFWKAVSDFKL